MIFYAGCWAMKTCVGGQKMEFREILQGAIDHLLCTSSKRGSVDCKAGIYFYIYPGAQRRHAANMPRWKDHSHWCEKGVITFTNILSVCFYLSGDQNPPQFIVVVKFTTIFFNHKKYFTPQNLLATWHSFSRSLFYNNLPCSTLIW
jgi:hypothetical protein